MKTEIQSTERSIGREYGASVGTGSIMSRNSAGSTERQQWPEELWWSRWVQVLVASIVTESAEQEVLIAEVAWSSYWPLRPQPASSFLRQRFPWSDPGFRSQCPLTLPSQAETKYKYTFIYSWNKHIQGWLPFSQYADTYMAAIVWVPVMAACSI